MGDSGEGLVDAEARIQERIEELRKDRERARKEPIVNPEQAQKIESLRLARTELSRQLEATGHPARKTQLAAAIAEVDRKLAALGDSV